MWYRLGFNHAGLIAISIYAPTQCTSLPIHAFHKSISAGRLAFWPQFWRVEAGGLHIETPSVHERAVWMAAAQPALLLLLQGPAFYFYHFCF